MEESKSQKQEWRTLLAADVPSHFKQMMFGEFLDAKNINYTNAKQHNVLMTYFVFSNKVNPNVVAALVAGGVNLAYQSPTGETCLTTAVQNKTTPSVVILILLRFGACANVVDRDGNSLIEMYCYAKREVDFRIVKAIFRAGFDFTLMNKKHFWQFRDCILKVLTEHQIAFLKMLNRDGKSKNQLMNGNSL